MKILRFAMLMVSLSVAGMAQSRNQAGNGRMDLTSALLELDRTAAATNSDISHLQIEKWKGGWKTGFTTNSSHKNQAAEVAQSLQRNLHGALPDLIRNALNSRGGLFATFKVYEDVNLVCQSLDSLAATAQEYGKKEEYAPLAGDYNNLVKLRRVLSTYIQQRAAAADGMNGTSSDFTSPGDGGLGPRKIVVDDGPAPKKSMASARKKKSSVTYSNVD